MKLVNYFAILRKKNLELKIYYRIEFTFLLFIAGIVLMVGEIDTNEMVSEINQSNVILLVCDFQILWNQMNTKVFNAEEEQITNGEGSKKHGSDFCSYTSCESVTSILIIIVQNQSFLISEKIHLKVTIIKPSYSFELTLLFALAATDGIYGLDSHWLFLLNHWSWLAVIFFGVY